MEFVTSLSRQHVQEELNRVLSEYVEHQLQNTLENPEKKTEARQEIIESLEEQRKEQEEKDMPGYRKILPKMPQYYYTISLMQPPTEDYFFVYTPGGITINRVPQSQLGHGVLGVAYPGYGLIMIADHLFGMDFEEVKKHEINHILYPFLTEYQIRQKTKTEFPFETRFH